MLQFDVTPPLHRHGDAWSPMQEREPHSPDDFDPERKLLAGYRVFQCTDCGEEVSIQTERSR